GDTGITVTNVVAEFVPPAASVTVALTVKVPGESNTCDAAWLPVKAPRVPLAPSPQSTVTSRTALPFDAAAVTTNVKEAGSPALGGVVGGVMRIVGAVEIVTVTEPDAWPDDAGGVVVLPPPLLLPPPPAGGDVVGGAGVAGA